MRAVARANGGARRRTNAVVRGAAQGKMMPGLPVPVALWWLLVKALILFIAWVLTKLGIHICRGSVFDTVGGRAAVVLAGLGVLVDPVDGLGEEGDYERPPPQRPVELPLGYSDGID